MDEQELAFLWYRRAGAVQQGHYLAALYFTRRHWFLGGLTVLLTAAVGTSVFATLSKQADLLVLTGALSIMATLSSSMQTFLAYGERADRHRVAGARYGVVGRSLELLMAKPEFNAAALDGIKEELDKLSQESPHIPDSVHKKMGEGVPPDPALQGRAANPQNHGQQR